MPGRSVPIRLSKLFVKVNDEELKNSRTQKLKKSGSVDQAGSVLFNNIFSPRRCRHRVVCRADYFGFLNP
jgi:hypothetical protein